VQVRLEHAGGHIMPPNGLKHDIRAFLAAHS
jgi:hypothetical protein